MQLKGVPQLLGHGRTLRILATLLALVPGLWLTLPGPGRVARAEDFLRGDVNADGAVSLADALMLRRYMFLGGLQPPCLKAADADNGEPVQGCSCGSKDGELNLVDAVVILRYLFMEEWTAILPEPFPLPGADPTEDDLPCAAYDPVSPEETDDLIRIGDVTAEPGEEIEIPVYLSNSVPVEGLQLVIEYDPEVLEFGECPDCINYEGTYFEQFEEAPPRAGVSLVGAVPEEGVFTVGIVGSLISGDYEIEPGEDQLVAKIRARVREDAPGGSLALVPTNGEDGSGSGPYSMRNEITHKGSAVLVSTLPERIPGLLIIGPDAVDYLRGDSNGDSGIDVSDAIFTLEYLFAGKESPDCPESADANSDGRLDVSDPIATLTHLFASGTPHNIGTCQPSTGDLGPCLRDRCAE